MSDARQSYERVRPGSGEGGQRAVLDAACDIFLTKGYAGTTMDDIADALHSTKGRVYHYYRSKLDILIDASLLALDEALTEVGAVARGSDLTPDVQIGQMARIHAASMMSRRSLLRAWIEGTEAHATRDASAAQVAAWEHCVELRDEYEQLFADVIVSGQESGVFAAGRPRLMTKALLGVLNWIHVWYDPNRSQTLQADEIADEIVAFIMRGVARD
jgi:AcrR family transcriptional regulator